jgi:hypothetical protein
MDEMESLRLAAQLQQFAMETTAAPTREEHPMPPLDAMDVDQGDEEDESEWVYDRYIRHKEVDSHTASASDMEMINSEGGFTKQTAVPGGSSGAVGLLVIREEDKADWEAFGQEDVDSDENRYSEDEDSNGKLACFLEPDFQETRPLLNGFLHVACCQVYVTPRRRRALMLHNVLESCLPCSTFPNNQAIKQ